MLHISWAAPLCFPVRWSWSLTLVSSSGFSRDLEKSTEEPKGSSQSQPSSASLNDSSSSGVICNSKFVSIFFLLLVPILTFPSQTISYDLFQSMNYTCFQMVKLHKSLLQLEFV